MKGFESYAYYDPKAGKRYRLLITDSGSKIPIFWFRLGKDGSLYIGHYITGQLRAKYGSVKAARDGAFISYDDGDEIDVTSDKNPTKISMHSSGIVHALGRRAFQSGIRNIASSTILCWLFFQRPKQSNLVRSWDVKNTDFLVPNFDVSFLRPFQCMIAIGPLANAKPIRPKNVVQSSCLAYQFDDTALGSLLLQMSFSDRNPAPWPPANYVVMKADPDT